MKKKEKEERWYVDYNKCSICRLEKGVQLYAGTGDGLFSSFKEAQSYLLTILKNQHALGIADMKNLPAKLAAIEAKIRIVNTSTEQDYI